jgi:putative transposase
METILTMADREDPADRDRWARLRFAIIGPLLAAPPAKGQLQSMLRELSFRTWQHPSTGLPVRFGTSTLERWYYAARRARHDPFGALKTRIRADAGRYKALSPRLIEALHVQYRDYPRWSVKLHYDNLHALLNDEEPFPSYGTVRSYFRAAALRKLPRRGRLTADSKQFAQREIRSFESEYANALWHLDFHAPMVCRYSSKSGLGQCFQLVTGCMAGSYGKLNGAESCEKTR